MSGQKIIQGLNEAVEYARMSDWQPIETAPRDRVIILAGQWTSGRWEIIAGGYLIKRWPYVGQTQPTHWMPLPEPPSGRIVPKSTPDWEDLRGRAPDATGDLSSEDFVRKLRDGWE